MTITINQKNYQRSLDWAIKDAAQGAPRTMLGSKLKTNEKIGIEVELEKVSANKIPYWSSTTDGSLKIRGREFTICVYSNKVSQALKILQQSLSQKDHSVRTSIHIHLDVSDLSTEELALLVMYYFIFETPLIQFSGGRFNNFFCVPINQWWDGNLDNLLKWPKYSSINVLPAIHGSKNAHYSTVEFRSMKGNLNTEYIQNWVNLIVSLKTFIRGKTLEEFFTWLFTANTDSSYYPLAKTIFKNNAALLYSPEMETTVEASILLLKNKILHKKYVTHSSENITYRLSKYSISPHIASCILKKSEKEENAQKIKTEIPTGFIPDIVLTANTATIQAQNTPLGQEETILAEFEDVFFNNLTVPPPGLTVPPPPPNPLNNL